MKILIVSAALAALFLAACQPAAFAPPGVPSAGGTSSPSVTNTPLPAEATPFPLTFQPTPTFFPPSANTPIGEIATEANPMSTLEPIPPEAEPLIHLAIQSLSRKMNIPAERIQAVFARAVTWHDASLGCPKPGVDYIRVETPGFNILLEADGSTYNYHTDLKDRVVQCASRPPGDIYLPP